MSLTTSAVGERLLVTSLAKNFGGVHALRDVTFEARAGSIHAILGQNGAGKSTLVKVLSGNVKPDRGGCELRGRQLPLRGRPRDARRAGVVTVAQELSVLPHLTVEENIWLTQLPLTRIGRADGAALRAQTLELLERYDAPALDPSERAGNLSVQQQQLVEIVKALATPAEVLLFDEPTSALGAHDSHWVLRTCRRLAEEGRIVLLVSHRLREIRSIADQATVMRAGEVVTTVPMAELSDLDIVTLTTGRRISQLYPHRPTPGRGETTLVVRDLQGPGLRGLDLTAHRGEILGVGGLEGQGQRELFRALVGAQWSRGRIEVDGSVVRPKSPRQAMRRAVGTVLVPDDRKRNGLLIERSIHENLMLSCGESMATWGWRNPRKERAAVARARERFGIVMRSPSDPVGRLSGGNQQKVLLARALEGGARIVLLYDPSRGVDVETKSQIFQLMRELAQSGTTVLFFSTDESELAHVPDRVVVLSEGRVAKVLEGDALTEEAIVGSALLAMRDLGTVGGEQ